MHDLYLKFNLHQRAVFEKQLSISEFFFTKIAEKIVEYLSRNVKILLNFRFPSHWSTRLAGLSSTLNPITW